jgi:hypothetical protein
MSQVGRLALRQEGEYWNAYYAPNDTMVGAILLGSVRMTFIHASEEIEQRFVDMVMKAMTIAIQEVTDETPEWGEPEPAPESERTKS